MAKKSSASLPARSLQIAHELQAPLTVLDARLSAGLEASWCKGEVEVLLSDCLRQVQDMKCLIVDVLLLDLAESGQLSRQADRLDLTLIVKGVVETLQPLAEANKVCIEMIDREPLPVSGDKRQLWRVFTNLVENAIKYTGPGGSIHLEAKRVGSSAEVRVCDTGIGIPSEELERVFERFYQVDPERSRSKGGVGLGLCIARAFAEGNGGSIGVTSTPGQGSCFTFKMRLA